MLQRLNHNGDTMILSSKTKRIFEVALANRTAKNELLEALGSHAVAGAIIATSTSLTANFGVLEVGNIVIRVKQGAAPVAPGVTFDVVTVAGTLPANVQAAGAAVVGDLYVVLKQV